jgi:hypothetical protein
MNGSTDATFETAPMQKLEELARLFASWRSAADAYLQLAFVTKH